MDYDPKLQLLAIGNKQGYIKMYPLHKDLNLNGYVFMHI